MTLDEILKKIHIKYEGDTSYPTVGEEDYEIRLEKVNQAIDEWAYLDDTYWTELFTNLSDAVDGDKTATTSQTQYDAPSDFRFISSFLTITDSSGNNYFYTYIRPDKVLSVQENDPSGKYFYITGKPSAYKINILNPIDGTINYSYYKTPTHLSQPTDVPEMSNPLFIVYSVVADLYELDNRNDMVNKYMQLAKQALDLMVVQNETKPFYHYSDDYEFNFGL